MNGEYMLERPVVMNARSPLTETFAARLKKLKGKNAKSIGLGVWLAF